MLNIKYCELHNMTADMFTKSLGKINFKELCYRIIFSVTAWGGGRGGGGVKICVHMQSLNIYVNFEDLNLIF